ncbi:MAG: efflux RND transporter periplasmic adaptor subunit [Acidobacteriota bacterium]
MSLRRLIPVLLLFLAGMAGCRKSAEPAAEAPQAPVVTVATARVDTLRDLATASGTVVPSSSADLTVFSTEPAEILDLPKKEGETVAVGDVLVRLDVASITQTLAALQLQMIEATNQADRARTELARQTSYLERGLTARNAYETSRAALSSAESSLSQLKAQLDTMQASQDRTVITAKFPGTVMKVWHAVGDTVRAGSDDPLLRVIDPKRVQVSVQLPIALLARVVPGQMATITAIGGTPEAGVVATKIPTTDPSAPTGEVRLGFTNPSTLPLDTPVSAEILFDQRTNALMVPASAVGRDSLGFYILIAGDDQHAHRRDVRLGLVTRDWAQVISGVANGDHVIATGRADLTDGSLFVISR